MRTPALHTERLDLTPLRLADSSEMVGALSNSELHVFIGGSPPTVTELESRYSDQVAGPASGEEVWHSWIIRPNETAKAVGFVPATVR